MNLRTRPRNVSEVSTHSLNDIMFFLLLFFLITSTMVNPNIVKMMLPKSTPDISGKAPRNVTISMTFEDKILVNKNETAMKDLPLILERELKGTEEPVILLAADERVPFGTVMQVMTIGKKLNARVLVATEKDK